MTTWRTLLPHELDEVERKIEAGEALDIGLLRSLVAMARRDLGADEELERQRKAAYQRGHEDGWSDGRAALREEGA